jgi:hypothetical protein
VFLSHHLFSRKVTWFQAIEIASELSIRPEIKLKMAEKWFRSCTNIPIDAPIDNVPQGGMAEW